MLALIVIGIMILCDCSAKTIGVFCVTYGVIVGFVRVIVNLMKNR